MASHLIESVNSSCKQNSAHGQLIQRAACTVGEMNGS